MPPAGDECAKQGHLCQGGQDSLPKVYPLQVGLLDVAIAQIAVMQAGYPLDCLQIYPFRCWTNQSQAA
jgi:hypothetical protein